MQLKFNPDGSDDIKKRPAIVVYAVNLIGKTPFIARDKVEEVFITSAIVDMGCIPISVDIEVPINFRGWYYPKPMKQSEPSIN